MVIMGGQNYETSTFFNDIQFFNLNLNFWTSSNVSNSYLSRYSTVAVSYENWVLFFGGIF